MSKNLLRNFERLTTWRRKDERAPHKPLLALLAIGRCLRGQDRLVEYDVIHRELLKLLETFGPYRKVYKPWEPFWRMQKDNIWEVTQPQRVPQQSNGSVSPSDLRQLKVRGGLPIELHETFSCDPVLALEIAKQLVDAHFPQTMRVAVLEATLGEYAFDDLHLKLMTPERAHSPMLYDAYSRRTRNQKFRQRVLWKYNHRCAVCGYSFEFPLGYWPALEAAHIKWHSHRGPDISENGLSLCVLHHELFDWGVFTVEPESLKVIISEVVLRGDSEGAVASLHEKPLEVIPKCNSDRPAEEYLIWHEKNVLRK